VSWLYRGTDGAEISKPMWDLN